VDGYDLAEREFVLLGHACRTADIIERIAADLVTTGTTTSNRFGETVTNPLLIEHRHQGHALAQTLAALRIPIETLDGPVVPQRRGGVRGAYGVRSAR
jgi:hypothetical protein